MNARGRMSLVASPCAEPTPHHRQGIEPIFFARNPVPERLPSVAVSFLAGVRAVDAADSHDIMEALDQLQIGVSYPDVDVIARQGDRSLAVEQASGPGDLFSARGYVVTLDNNT